MDIPRTLVAAAVLATASCQEPAIGDAPDFEGRPTTPDAAPDSIPDATTLPDVTTPDSGPVESTLVQTESDAIIELNSVSCHEQDDDGNPVQHRENSYYRVFSLPEEGIAGDFSVTSVRIGIERASTPDNGVQPATVRLHTLVGDLLLGNLTERAAADIEVVPQTASFLDVPIQATIAAGSTLVVELFTPNSTVGRLLFIGSNDLGESAPGFIRAPADGCNAPEPVEIGTVSPDHPAVHILMTVTGTHF